MGLSHLMREAINRSSEANRADREPRDDEGHQWPSAAGATRGHAGHSTHVARLECTYVSRLPANMRSMHMTSMPVSRLNVRNSNMRITSVSSPMAAKMRINSSSRDHGH